MTTRLNRDVLREKIEEYGLAEAAIRTTLGISTLEKLRAGTYKSKLSKRTISKMCAGLKISEGQLFSGATEGNKAS